MAPEDSCPAIGTTVEQAVQFALARTALFFEVTLSPTSLALDATARRASIPDKGLAAVPAAGTKHFVLGAFAAFFLVNLFAVTTKINAAAVGV